jgi:hypothetical protein
MERNNTYNRPYTEAGKWFPASQANFPILGPLNINIPFSGRLRPISRLLELVSLSAHAGTNFTEFSYKESVRQLFATVFDSADSVRSPLHFIPDMIRQIGIVGNLGSTPIAIVNLASEAFDPELLPRHKMASAIGLLAETVPFVSNTVIQSQRLRELSIRVSVARVMTMHNRLINSQDKRQQLNSAKIHYNSMIQTDNTKTRYIDNLIKQELTQINAIKLRKLIVNNFILSCKILLDSPWLADDKKTAISNDMNKCSKFLNSTNK